MIFGREPVAPLGRSWLVMLLGGVLGGHGIVPDGVMAVAAAASCGVLSGCLVEAETLDLARGAAGLALLKPFADGLGEDFLGGLAFGAGGIEQLMQLIERQGDLRASEDFVRRPLRDVVSEPFPAGNGGVVHLVA